MSKERKIRYTVPLQRKTRCHECGTWAIAAICPLCKEPRPAFSMLLNATTALSVKPHIRGKA